MTQNDQNTTKTTKKKNLWMVFLVPALILVLAIWYTMSQSGSSVNPADLVLKNYDVEGTAKTAFGSDIPKSKVEAIRFRDSLEGAPEDAQDVSENGSGKVLLWAEDTEDGGKALTIAGDGAVYAPADASYLFGGKEYYWKLQTLELNGVLKTPNTTTMKAMFYGCSALTQLDLTGFDTRNVESMDWMFAGCENLEALDLSHFDTQKVMEFGWMFQNCGALKTLDLSSFQVSAEADTFLMFQKCTGLEDLKASEALTAQAESER